MDVRSRHEDEDYEWLSPKEAAAILPGTSARSVRAWCADGQIRGAVQLPSKRWQIPWGAVVEILGFDPRQEPNVMRKLREVREVEEAWAEGEHLPGLEE